VSSQLSAAIEGRQTGAAKRHIGFAYADRLHKSPVNALFGANRSLLAPLSRRASSASFSYLGSGDRLSWSACYCAREYYQSVETIDLCSSPRFSLQGIGHLGPNASFAQQQIGPAID